MNKSIHQANCDGCAQQMAVYEVPIPNPGAVNVHLHATCENKQCVLHGKPVHKDCLSGCNGRLDCPVHSDLGQHLPYRDCEGGHPCGVPGCH